MIKNFFYLCFLFLSIQLFSQNIDQIRSVVNFSSESELISYIKKTKSNGLSLIEVEQLALTQGAKQPEIQLLRKLWNSNNNQLSKNSDVKKNKHAIKIKTPPEKGILSPWFNKNL